MIRSAPWQQRTTARCMCVFALLLWTGYTRTSMLEYARPRFPWQTRCIMHASQLSPGYLFEVARCKLYSVEWANHVSICRGERRVQLKALVHMGGLVSESALAGYAHIMA